MQDNVKGNSDVEYEKETAYQRLYYRAFNGMSKILEGLPKDDSHPAVARLKALQFELEYLYIKWDYDSKKMNDE